MKYILITAAALHIFGCGKRIPFILAATLQTFYVVSRGVELGRLPIIGPHDTIAFYAASIALMAVPFVISRQISSPQTFAWITAAFSGFFTLFSLMFKPSLFPLPPVLKTMWFEFHVALAFFAYGLFTIGAVLGGIYLAKGERKLLDFQYRAALTGYSFFSASMVTGGIWGYYAWGTYWLWTPKELWTAVLWLFYTLYLHFRLKGKEWDRVTAWCGIAGFLVTIFTYLGVSMLLKSSHSF